MTQTTGDRPGAAPAAGQPHGTGHTPGADATTGRTQEAARREGERLAGDARSIADDAQRAARDTADATKERAADELSATARALRTAAGELDEHSVQRQFFDRAAEGLGEVADAIHGRSIGEMSEELSRLGRRNPTLFLGTAALAGFALARFGRATAPAPGYGAHRPQGMATATQSASPATATPRPASPAAGRTGGANPIDPLAGSSVKSSERSTSDV